MQIRNRGTKDPLKIVRKLDAFPKIPEQYIETTKVGGTRKYFSMFFFLFCNLSHICTFFLY